MKTLVIITFLFLFSTFTVGQEFTVVYPTPCPLTKNDLPALHGLKLGMTSEEVEKSLNMKLELEDIETRFMQKIPNRPMSMGMTHIERKTEKSIGEKQFIFHPDSSERRSTSKYDYIPGSFAVGFYENVLFGFALFYDEKTFDFSKPRKLSEVVAERLNLPKNNWRSDNWMRCQDFQINLGHYNDYVSVDIFDPKIREELIEKARKVVEKEDNLKKEKAIKPKNN